MYTGEASVDMDMDTKFHIRGQSGHKPPFYVNGCMDHWIIKQICANFFGTEASLDLSYGML